MAYICTELAPTHSYVIGEEVANILPASGGSLATTRHSMGAMTASCRTLLRAGISLKIDNFRFILSDPFSRKEVVHLTTFLMQPRDFSFAQTMW